MSSLIVQQGKFSTMIAGIVKDIRARSHQKSGIKLLRFALRRCAWGDIFHFEQSYLLSQTITLPLPEFKPQIPVTFRVATPDDMPLIETLYSHPSVVEAHWRMIERGDQMVMALDGERLIGMQLATPYFDGWQKSSVPHEHAYLAIAQMLPVTSSDAYIHGLYIDPEYRGLKIATPLVVFNMAKLYERGIRRVFNTIITDNEPSLHTSYRVGRRPIAMFTSIQGLQWVYMRTAPLREDPLAARLSQSTLLS